MSMNPEHDLAEALEQARRSERRLRAQYAVTRVLAESVTLKNAGRELLRAIAESLGWELGRARGHRSISRCRCRGRRLVDR